MNRGLHALRRIALVLSPISIAVTAWAQATAQMSGRITVSRKPSGFRNVQGAIT
jgi:hypothetical protein